MKTVTTLLEKGNLTARERFILLIQNDVHQMQTGKEILTEADKAALENWQATNNHEAQEWNQLNDGWKHAGRLGIEVELCFSEAQIAYLQLKPIILELLKHPLQREVETMFQGIKNTKTVSPQEALAIMEKQRAVKLAEGMNFEYAAYQLAFERLSQADQERLLELYGDIRTDHSYLDQEEIIATLLDGKEELSEAAKEKLGQLIAEQAYNAFAKEHQLFHYFACIPLAEVARYYLKKRDVKIGGKALAKDQGADDEDMSTHKRLQKAVEQYAKERRITVEAILKQGFIEWYDAEGWVYLPLIVSDDKELFGRWLASRAAARAELSGLVESGVLQLRERTAEEHSKHQLSGKKLYESELLSAQGIVDVLALRPSGVVITGESIYKLPDEYGFAKDFRERTDEYDPNLGIVYADDDPEHKGDHLDRELLISSLMGDGKPAFFSMHNLYLKRLEALLESVNFFKEEKKGGKTMLRFKNKQIEEMFHSSCASLIKAYGKMLALRELLTELSDRYETDLAFRVKGALLFLERDVQSINEALRVAQGPLRYKKMEEEETQKVVAAVDKTWFIHSDTIVPDEELLREHREKLKKIFRDF